MTPRGPRWPTWARAPACRSSKTSAARCCWWPTTAPRSRASLTARASTQRRRQLAEAEGAAAKADQTIQMAQVVLAAGFFLFLGYPAVVAVMGV